MQILEGELAIGTDSLENHAELLDFLGGLVEIRTPVNGFVRMLDHHGSDIEDLRHDALGNHHADMLVIPVLF